MTLGFRKLYKINFCVNGVIITNQVFDIKSEIPCSQMRTNFGTCNT